MQLLVLVLSVLVFTSIIMAVTLGLAWRMFDRPRHALTWCCAFICGAVQWTLNGVGLVLAPHHLAFPFVAGTLVGLMSILITIGARQRAGLPEHRARFGAAWGGLVLLLALFSFYVPTTAGRLATTNAFATLIAPIAALAIRPSGRRSNGSEMMLQTCLWLFWLFMATLTLLAARIHGAGAVAALQLYRSVLVLGLAPIGIALGVALCFVLAGDIAERLHALVLRDPLTGALNRRGFDEAATKALAGAKRYGRSMTLVVADLDCFKAINDQQGHAAGDRALRRFATAATGIVRTEDVFARLGGDEFCLLLEGTPDAAMRVVERLRDGVGDALTASFGLARLRGTESLDDLIGRADVALYRAKADGRDRAILEAA